MIYASILEDLLIPLFPIPDPVNVFAFLVHPEKGEKHIWILMNHSPIYPLSALSNVHVVAEIIEQV